MAQSEHEPAVNERVRDYRKRMRQQGMRPIQLWVADVRAPGFAAEAHRQSAIVAASSHAQDDQAFVDALSLDDE
jgi:surfactin synthase thioesterase subunit